MTVVEEPTQARTGTYLYGVVAAGRLAAGVFDGARSVDGEHAVRLVPAGDVAAIVSDVPLSEFDEDVLPARLNDLAWLEDAARAHEEVLERALGQTGVVPFRFCTIYRSEDDLLRFVVERADDLCRVLDGVEGRIELGVKGLVARDVLEGALRSHVGAEESGPAEGSGRAYLLRRREDRRLAEESMRFLADCATAATARLERAAVAASLIPVRPPERDAAETMFLNAAYLVAAGDESLAREAEALAAEYEPFGIRFELTGPWPPYNFVPRDVLQP
jgi:hypothetical protein